ncbi:MAG: hypothetical protein LBM00_08625, partial [Deltaproteobacteria bacterium]|nr:hypothetical protein [Deltaproteobacteria bacterium]
MRSRKRLCICFAVGLSLFCPAFLSAGTTYGAAARFSGRDIMIDPRVAEEAVTERCARPGALGAEFVEGCAAGFKQARDIFFSDIQRGFDTDEECALAETRFRQGRRQYLSNLSGWCVAEFSDIYSRKGCRDAGDIYFSVLSGQGFCPRAPAVAPQTPASAAPESAPEIHPLEPEANGFITGQYLDYYKDPEQIFDSPKMGRWPGSRVSGRSRAEAENVSGNAAGKQAREVKAAEAAAGGNTPGDPIPLKITVPQASGNRPSTSPDPAPALSGGIQGAGQVQAGQPEGAAQAGGSGAAALDFSRPVVIDSSAPGRSAD